MTTALINPSLLNTASNLSAVAAEHFRDWASAGLAGVEGEPESFQDARVSLDEDEPLPDHPESPGLPDFIKLAQSRP